MTILRTFCALILCCFCLVPAASAAELAGSAGRLPACPDSPNCVSSDAEDEQHRIAALSFTIPADKAWQMLIEQVEQLPRTNVVTQRSDYLHAECRSKMFGFVDNLEFRLRVGEGKIAVRAAARSGYYDFGVNRRRVEALRKALGNAGIAGVQQ